MASRPLSGTEIRTLVQEVAERLDPKGKRHVLIIVGGSLLAWRGLRETTEDVDSVRLIDDEVRSAVASVAAAYRLIGSTPTLPCSSRRRLTRTPATF
jgi:hypothetical protein